jgi:hypothetical protein
LGLRGTRGNRRVRKLQNVELNDLYSSSSIVRVIISRKMKWVEHVARIGERRGLYRFWWGNLRKRRHLEDPGVDRKII